MFEERRKVAVTVIIPVYNSGKSVLKAINSIYEQSLRNIELIIVDDGSDSETKKILSSVERKKNLRIISKENGGVSSARNIGILNARGNYVFFLDSDDYVDNNFLGDLYSKAIQNNLDMVCGSIIEHNSTRMDYEKKNCGYSFVTKDDNIIGKNLSLLYLWSACGKLFKKDNIENIDLLFDEDMNIGEDLYFTYNYIMNFSNIGFVNTSSYHIENSDSNSLSKKYIDNIEHSLEEQVRLWTNFEEKRPILADWYYKTHLDFKFYQVTLFISNLYKNGVTLSHNEKYEMLKNFLDKHEEWMIINERRRLPKNIKDKILYKAILTKKCNYILFVFFIKESLRKLRFNLGRIIGEG